MEDVWSGSHVLWKRHYESDSLAFPWHSTLIVIRKPHRFPPLFAFSKQNILFPFSSLSPTFSLLQSHYKDALQDGSQQDPRIELDSPDFDGRNSIMESPDGSCDSCSSEKSAMCAVSWIRRLQGTWIEASPPHRLLLRTAWAEASNLCVDTSSFTVCDHLWLSAFVSAWLCCAHECIQ